MRFHLPAQDELTAISIKFDDFKNTAGTSVSFENVKSIVFSIRGDYSSYQEFELAVSQVSFGKATLSTATVHQDRALSLTNYPNPVVDLTTIQLKDAAASVQLQVYDMMGRMISKEQVNTTQGGSKITYNASNLRAGMYTYVVAYNDGTSNSGKLIKR